MVLSIIFLEDKHKIVLHLSILYEYQQFFQHRICFSIQPQLQLVNVHRNRRYFVIKLHTWFCLSYFLRTNMKFYIIYEYLMSINSFFNTVSVSRYSRPITVTCYPGHTSGLECVKTKHISLHFKINVFGGTPDSVRLTAHNARAIKMINYSVLSLFPFFKH
jgi:hypothetical protein